MRAREALLLFGLIFRAIGVIVARGVDNPEPGSLTEAVSLRTDNNDLAGDDGLVGNKGGVSGAFVAILPIRGRACSDRNRVLVNEDGMGEGDLNDLLCRSRGSCSVIVICRVCLSDVLT